MSDIISDRVRKIRFLALGVIALLALFVHPVAAAPGDLDTTFGTGGKVTTSIAVSAPLERPATGRTHFCAMAGSGG